MDKKGAKISIKYCAIKIALCDCNIGPSRYDISGLWSIDCEIHRHQNTKVESNNEFYSYLLSNNLPTVQLYFMIIGKCNLK